MISTMNYIDYRKKLGLSFDDETKVEMFLAKAHNFFIDEIENGHFITEDIYCSFFDDAGIQRTTYDEYVDSGCVARILAEKTSNIKDFLYYFTIWINCLNDKKMQSCTQRQYINAFKIWEDESNLHFTFLNDDNKKFIFPEGAKELDDKLVSEPLEWLKAYPPTHKQFCLTLKQYDDPESIRDVADNLRKTLEGFLQEFFNNTKILANNKSEVGNYLKSKNVDSELISLFTSLLSNFDQANNAVAKHHDNIHRNMLEFILYQTGTFIRTLIKLKEDI